MRLRWLTLLVFAGALLASVFAQAATMKLGDSGRQVLILQENLAQLGFFRAAPTGYYGTVTRNAVRDFQRAVGLRADGIAGPQTLAAVDDAMARLTGSTASRGGGNVVELLPWRMVNPMWPRGTTARVYDIETGLSFAAWRLYGSEHADVEPLTQADTYIMRKIYGGHWSWNRRAVLVELDGKFIAGSMNGMPHGYYEIRNNGFPGQFCIHFLGSRLHKNRQVDPVHQNMVLKAAKTGIHGLAAPVEFGRTEGSSELRELTEQAAASPRAVE